MTEFGIVMLFNPPQFTNASPSIVVTDGGMRIFERLELLLKALAPIFTTEFGITVFRHPLNNVLLYVSIIALQLLRES